VFRRIKKKRREGEKEGGGTKLTIEWVRNEAGKEVRALANAICPGVCISIIYCIAEPWAETLTDARARFKGGTSINYTV